jgi:hypothetical protein
VAVTYRGDDPTLFLRKTTKEVVAILNDEATQLETELVSATPADTGNLRQGWTMRPATPDRMVSIVGQSKIHFLPTELGRKPGTGISREGQDAVSVWAARKLGLDNSTAGGEANQFAQALSRKYVSMGRPAQGFAGLATPGTTPKGSPPSNLVPVGGPIKAGFDRLRNRLS